MSIAWVANDIACRKNHDFFKNYFVSHITECIMGRLLVL